MSLQCKECGSIFELEAMASECPECGAGSTQISKVDLSSEKNEVESLLDEAAGAMLDLPHG